MPRTDNLTIFMFRFRINSGSPKLLQPQGPVQDCKGLATCYGKYSFLDGSCAWPKICL